VVRVQARRLRTRLTKYYQEEGAHHSIGIEMPKCGTLLFSGNRTLCLPVLANRNTITVARFCIKARRMILDILLRLDPRDVWSDQPGHGARQIDLREAANRLDAAMPVSGSVRQAGSAIRVSAQIIDGSSGAYVWSESVDGNLDDVLGLL